MQMHCKLYICKTSGHNKAVYVNKIEQKMKKITIKKKYR